MDVLAEVLGQSDADQFDLLCHLVFASPLHTRSERATAFVNRESRFLKAHKPDAQEVILREFDFSVEENLVGNIPELRIRFFF